ncbi:MAG: class I SAM-dependent methyltransferase [Bacteroidota bacterium]|nr:class I SAM-dependent methyltransferase [Bacteroidota bacterium]
MKDEKLKQIFEKAAQRNSWGDPDSLSGPGSNHYQTRIIREAIPGLLSEYKIKKMLDAPCGDFFWMKEIIGKLTFILESYTGADLVADLVKNNEVKFGNEKVNFIQLNLIEQIVPQVDLIFTRDCFLHLSYQNIYKILLNYKKSGSAYLLLSTYAYETRINTNVPGFSLHGRALNMMKFPFNFPDPLRIINEGCTEGNHAYADKSLCLWEIKNIPLFKIKINIGLISTITFLKEIPVSILNFSKRVFNKLKRIAVRK